mgnify:CR=1 FL=1
MNQPVHTTTPLNRPFLWRFSSSAFTDNVPRKGKRIPLKTNKYNEQRDEETGYGYFGVRYMDHELMTMWLSVDPMSDKYPSISPYAYCNWNPIKLVDPDGNEITFAGESERKLYESFRELVFSNEKYTAIQNELISLEESDDVFIIRMGKNISNKEGAGNFSYNVNTGQFDINISNDNSWTDIEKLSHELKHADQYLNRKITFSISASGKVTPENYSIDDEIEAYSCQEMFGNSLSSKDVIKKYSDLHYYGENETFKPTQEHIIINSFFLQGKKHPGFLYHDWKKDLSK